MTTNQRSLPLEQLLFLFAFLLAAAVRFTHLGLAPLNDNEASQALQALQLVRGEHPSLAGQPLYILSTSALFFLFGSANFVARFLPALAGSLLIPLFYLSRRQLGVAPALVLSFALALDPGFVSQSRLAGSPMPALTALAFAVYFWSNRRLSLNGLCLGFALLSAPAVIHGILGVFLAFIAARALERRLNAEHLPYPLSIFTLPAEKHTWQKGLLATSLTLLLAGTLFLLVPQGLSALAGALPDYLLGWGKPAGVPAGWLILTLSVYHPIAILFAVSAVFRSFFWRNSASQPDGLQRFLVLWFLISFLLCLIYPGRQMGDLLWPLLPLWLLAAQEIARIAVPMEKPRWILLLQASLTFIFLTLFWLQVAAYSQVLYTLGFNLLRLATIFSTLVLVALLVWLVDLAQSRRAAWQGLSVGLLAALSLYTLSCTFGSAFNYPWSQVFRQEFWKPYPQIGDADLLQKTIQDLSSWSTGRPDRLSITLAVNSPALHWLLRHQTNLTLLPEDAVLHGFRLGQDSPIPDILITRANSPGPSLTTAFRGQDFNWWFLPIWQYSPPADPLAWALFRRAQWQAEPVILWARSDLFPGGTASPAPAQQPIPEEQFEDSPPAQ
ncbi:MAG: hypothetical protein ACOY16_06070 [Chloroflexota bacterium]